MSRPAPSRRQTPSPGVAMGSLSAPLSRRRLASSRGKAAGALDWQGARQFVTRNRLAQAPHSALHAPQPPVFPVTDRHRSCARITERNKPRDPVRHRPNQAHDRRVPRRHSHSPLSVQLGPTRLCLAPVPPALRRREYEPYTVGIRGPSRRCRRSPGFSRDVFSAGPGYQVSRPYDGPRAQM